MSAGHSPSGSIPVRSGTVRLGVMGAVEDARLELAVAGIETGNRHRDRDLRKPRFLAADEHPVIVVHAGPAPPPRGWVAQAQGRSDVRPGLRGRSREAPARYRA